MALFNTSHSSKLLFSSELGVNHSTGNDNSRNGNGCRWPTPSANAQLYHCKIMCRTNVVPNATKTTNLLRFGPMSLPVAYSPYVFKLRNTPQ